MKLPELHRRLGMVGLTIGPSSFPKGSQAASLWAGVCVDGVVVNVPAIQDPPLREEESEVDRAIRRLLLNGIRLDWPEWLDGPIDRCPVCGTSVDRWMHGESWMLVCCQPGGCWTFTLPGNGAVPTWAEWMAKAAPGRWALYDFGHPLGVAR